MSSTYVPFHHVDREWDARFNVPVVEDVDLLVANIKSEAQAGKYRYVMISGIEVGTKPYQPDYLIRHVHVAFVFINRVSKSSILKNLQIKQNLGYYLVPRNKSLPYSGWVKHHKKTESKLDESSLTLYEYGTLPLDKTGVSDQVTKRSETEKKRKLDEIIIEMKEMIERGEDDEAFKKFPRNYLTYGEKLKSIIPQRRDFFQSNGNPHIWLSGGPGSGKSAILQVVYPDYYNKNLDTKFFDRYDSKTHTHVLLQDVDHGTVEKLGAQFLKSICDEAGYPVDQKYKTPQIERLTILVTSNFNIRDVLPEDMPGRRENLAAIERRFFAVNIRDLLHTLGIKLLSKYEITQLKKQGNTDPKAIFMAWDYLRDCPTGDPLKAPEDYQQMIKDAYYKTFDRSRKMQDSGSQTKTDNRYDETAIDPIKQDWHIFRGPPDFTHTSLPFLFENRIQTNLNNYDHVFRLTSPYDPMISTDLVDVNVGAGTTTFGIARSNVGDTKDKYGQCQFYNFYADMYRFYSVIAVSYKVTVENLSGERMYVHVMKYNQELPPQNVSNHDMLLWKGVKSYLSTPHAMFWNDTSAQFNDYNAIQIEDDEDLNATPNPDPTATNYAVTRNGSKAVIQHSAQYTPGDFRREIVLDSEISTWTSIAANPSYPERLLIRVKAYDDNIHPTAGSATSYNKSMHYAIKVELEYLTEFKELNPELRYPVVRDPARLTLFSSNR